MTPEETLEPAEPEETLRSEAPLKPEKFDELDDEPTAADYRRLMLMSGSCLLFMVAAFVLWLALATMIFG